MKYYRITKKVSLDTWDFKEPAGLFQRSHDWIIPKQGVAIIDYENDKESGEPFQGPLICELDDEDCTGVLPVFFLSPAFIATKAFYQDLIDIGIDNIDVHEVIINDPVNNRAINDYLLLNILGSVSCAVMADCGYERINEDGDPDDPLDSMNMIDDLVIDASKIGDIELFVVREDPDCILFSERVYKYLQAKGYTDIWFDEVPQIN